MEYRGSEHPAHLIEDVVLRQTQPYFDVRREHTRRQSIGALDDQYALFHAPRLQPAYSSSLAAGSMSSRSLLARPYTRVPPLQSLPVWYQEHDRHVAALSITAKELMSSTLGELVWLLQQANRATRRQLRKLTSLLAEVRHIFVVASLALLHGMDKITPDLIRRRYTLQTGVVTEVQVPALARSRAKSALVMLLVLLVVVGATLAWPFKSQAPGTANAPVKQPAVARTVSRTTGRVPHSATTGGSTSGTLAQSGSQSAAPVSPSTSHAAIAAQSPANNLASTVGSVTSIPSTGTVDNGGSSAIPTPPATSSTSSQPITVSLPPITIGIGSQPIVSTGGMSITVP